MKRQGILAFSLVLFSAAGSASADQLTATLGEPLREVSHTVDIQITEGVATYTVTRTFANEGKRSDEVSLDISLPVGAVATGLRIRAGEVWYEGDLMDAEEAAKLYTELTGIGIHRPKDPALLYWVSQELLHLQMFPVFPGKTSTVEYTLTVPTQYVAGRYYLSYPQIQATGGLSAPIIRVLSAHQGTRVFLDEKLVAVDAPLALVVPVTEQAEPTAPAPDATTVTSRLETKERGRIKSATIELAIEHTYRGDLQVELVSPDGARTTVHDRTGGGENDLKGKFPLPALAGKEITGAWQLVVTDHLRIDVGTLRGWALHLTQESGETLILRATDTPLFLPDAPERADTGDDPVGSGFHKLTITPGPIDTLAARLGKIDVSKEKSVVRLELDAAPELRPLPKALKVVFVVDASYSRDEEGINAQLNLAEAFLSHVPDARFDVVLFRRSATRMVGSFAEAKDFSALRKKAQDEGRLKAGNGSALDEGLALAASALSGQKGPTMIVALTDGFLRNAFQNPLAIQALAKAPAKTTVHLVLPGLDNYTLTEERDDENTLAEIAKPSGGVLFRISEPAEVSPEKLAKVALGLVRPVRIDYFRIKAEGLEEVMSVPETFEEGDGLREMHITAKAPSKVVLEGMLWSTPWRREVAVDKPFSKKTAAFVFSEDLFWELSEKEQRKAAYAGGAVSPVTSYLAVEPGVRPSTDGIDRLGYGSGSGTIGGRGVGSALLRQSASVRIPALADLVATGARLCREKHPAPKDFSAKLSVETTYDEIVDVLLDAGDAKDPLTACLIEAVWAVRLPGSYIARHNTHALQF